MNIENIAKKVYNQSLTNSDKIKAKELNDYSQQIAKYHKVSYRYRNFTKLNKMLNLLEKIKNKNRK